MWRARLMGDFRRRLMAQRPMAIFLALVPVALGMADIAQVSPAASAKKETLFARITEGPHVNDGGWSFGVSWVDYDGDDYPDIYVNNDILGSTGELNFLYHNNGDGTYTKVLEGIIPAEGGSGVSTWADCDNDGDMAYSYWALKNLDSALLMIGKYIEMAPDEANPFDSRGNIMIAMGRLDEAAASFRQALKIKPDFSTSLVSLGLVSIFTGDYAAADSCFMEATRFSEGVYRIMGRLGGVYLLVYQGKLHQALLRVYDGYAATRLE